MAYDIIGDVHGHVRELRTLLEKMGYREGRGIYRHSSRTAIFVGDLIDRGPANIEAATDLPLKYPPSGIRVAA